MNIYEKVIISSIISFQQETNNEELSINILFDTITSASRNNLNL